MIFLMKFKMMSKKFQNLYNKLNNQYRMPTREHTVNTFWTSAEYLLHFIKSSEMYSKVFKVKILRMVIVVLHVELSVGIPKKMEMKI